MTGPWNNYGDPPPAGIGLGISGSGFTSGPVRATMPERVSCVDIPPRTPRKGVGEFMRLLEGTGTEQRSELLTYIGCLEQSEDRLLGILGRLCGEKTQDKKAKTAG